MKNSKETYCFGLTCPLKENCARHYEDFEPKKDSRFAWIPFNKEKNKCEHFIDKKTGEQDPTGALLD